MLAQRWLFDAAARSIYNHTMLHDAITAKNAVVLGVSADSAAKHDKFIEKFDLPFTLIADEDKSICESYGVWGNKSFMGRTFLGIKRMTFLINADGVVQKVWPKVKVADHANEVLEALGELGAVSYTHLTLPTKA